MKMRLCVMLLIWGCASLSWANEPEGALPACDAYVSASDPFDPSGDLVLRRAALAALERDAGHLNSFQLYGLGALYRLGRDHPAALVDQDLTKARRYLVEASLGGEVAAYASMAELELAAGDPKEAMTWAQVYTRAARVQAQGGGRGLGYPANLIKRINAALRPVNEEEQVRRLGIFMQQHGEKFKARLEQSKAANAGAGCRSINDDWKTTLLADASTLSKPMRSQARRLENASTGSVVFLALVNTDGTVAKVTVIESVPSAKVARALEGSVRQLRFNAVEATAPQRTTILPWGVDDGTARLRD